MNSTPAYVTFPRHTVLCCFCSKCDRGRVFFFFMFFFWHRLDHGLETPVKQKNLLPVKGVVI